jgi:hypothetical protein
MQKNKLTKETNGGENYDKNIEVNYLKKKNINIISYFIFNCDTMTLLYYDSDDKKELCKIYRKVILKTIVYYKQIYSYIPENMKDIYVIYTHVKEKHDHNFIKKIKEYMKSSENLKKFMIEQLKKKYDDERINNIIENYNKIEEDSKKNNTYNVIEQIEYYIELHNKYITKYIDIIESYIKYDKHHTYYKILQSIIKNMRIKKSLCFFNREIKKRIFEILVKNISNNYYTNNINEEFGDNYVNCYVTMIYKFIYIITNFIYNKYSKIYSDRLVYKTENKYAKFRENYNMIIKCWYDLDRFTNDNKYHVINHDNQNVCAYIIKSQFIKAVKYRKSILDKIYVVDNINNINNITEKEIFENLKDMKLDGNYKISTETLLEKIELAVITYKNATINIKNIDMSIKHIRNNFNSTYELTEKETKQYIIDMYGSNIEQSELIDRMLQKYNIKLEKKKIFSELLKNMKYKSDEEMKKKSGSELCKTQLFTYTDIKDNYGKLYYPKEEVFDIKSLCFEKIDDKIFLELIHPKYYYYMYIDNKKYPNFKEEIIKYYIEKNNKEKKIEINKDFELEPYQKQGIFGITDYTIDFRKCHHFFFMGFRQFYNNEKNELGHSIIDYYSYTLNKVVNYCMSKRENLFAVRFINNGTIAWQRPLNNPNFEKEFIEKLSNNDIIFLGVIQKKLEKIQNMEDNTIQSFVVYSTLYNGIFTLDETLSSVMDNVIKWPITFTFLELQQFCNYLGMYGYMYKDNTYDLYFSKYNIFDEKCIYDPEVYLPLKLEQFEDVLKHLKKKLIPLSCFKFPPLKNVPKCAINQMKKINDEKNAKYDMTLKNDINDKYDETINLEFFNNKCLDSQIYIAKYNNIDKKDCVITEHRANKKDTYTWDYKMKKQFGGKNEFKLVFTENIKYYYKHANHINNFYKLLKETQDIYGKNILVELENGFNYELVCTINISGYEKINKYTSFISDNEVKRFFADKKHDTILKYKNISNGFCEIYELLYKYNFKKMLNNKNKILEISNFTTYLEAFLVYLGNNNINTKDMIFDVMVPKIYINENYVKKMNLICEKFNLNRKEYDLYKIPKCKIKYDIIFLATRTKNMYSVSPYWIHSDNKIKIFYLIVALLNLSKNGNLVMRFCWIRSEVQRDIYYLFKHIFQKVTLYIPECSYLYSSYDGLIIGEGYKKNINDTIFTNFLLELKDINDNIHINFPDFLKKLNKDNNGPINFAIEDNRKTTEYTTKCIKRFYVTSNNINYEEELDRYFMNYYNGILNNFNFIKLYKKYPDYQILNKLMICIKWAKKYGLELNITYDTNISNYDISRYIINIMYGKNNMHVINMYDYDKSNDIINLGNLFDKYIEYTSFRNKNKEYNLTKYNTIMSELYPYTQIYNLYTVNVKDKYLTTQWFIFYELLNFYDIIRNNSNIHINAKNSSIIKSVINYYTNIIFYDETVSIEYNLKKSNLIIINRKKNIVENLDIIIKNKSDSIIRLHIGLINNEKIVHKICDIIKMYDHVYFHKSQIDPLNNTFLILKQYNNKKKNVDRDVIINNFLHMCYDMIGFIIDDEILKSIVMTRYNMITNDFLLTQLINNLKQKKINRYVEIFLVPRILLI